MRARAALPSLPRSIDLVPARSGVPTLASRLNESARRMAVPLGGALLKPVRVQPAAQTHPCPNRSVQPLAFALRQAGIREEVAMHSFPIACSVQ